MSIEFIDFTYLLNNKLRLNFNNLFNLLLNHGKLCLNFLIVIEKEVITLF